MEPLMEMDAAWVGGGLVTGMTGNPTGGAWEVGRPGGGFLGDGPTSIEDVIEQTEEVVELIERLRGEEEEDEEEVEAEAEAEAAAEEMALWPLAVAGALLVVGTGLAVVVVGGLVVASGRMK